MLVHRCNANISFYSHCRSFGLIVGFTMAIHWIYTGSTLAVKHVDLDNILAPLGDRCWRYILVVLCQQYNLILSQSKVTYSRCRANAKPPLAHEMFSKCKSDVVLPKLNVNNALPFWWQCRAIVAPTLAHLFIVIIGLQFYKQRGSNVKVNDEPMFTRQMFSQ